MRPTQTYITVKYAELNDRIFGGQLPQVPLRIGRGLRRLGGFRYPLRVNGVSSRRRVAGQCSIMISGAYDRPAIDIDSTLAHEMIHAWLWFRCEEDNTPHGPRFRQLMDQINAQEGLRIEVRSALDSEVRESSRPRLRNVCVTEWADGELAVTVVAESCVGEINRAFRTSLRVRRIEWWVCSDSWLSRFPQSRTAKAYCLSREEYQRYIAATGTLVK